MTAQSELARPGAGVLFTAWQPQPLALIVLVALVLGYAAGLRTLRRRGVAWACWRTVTFGVGLAVFAWTSNGYPNVYRHALYWVWVSQVLVLWLLVPLLLLGGGLLHLALAVAGPRSAIARAVRTRPVRVLSNPLIAPALVPVLSGVLFFGPLPGWTIAMPAVGWVLQVALVLIGAVMVLPLVGPEEDVPSLTVGLALGVGMFELVLDALPGVVLRLHSNLVTSYFDHRTQYSWSGAAIKDQHTAGSVVWVVAEIIDLPFLLIVFRRWARADARDAARIDAVLDAERIARGEPESEGELGPTDRPWWEADAELSRRYDRGQRRA